MSTAGESPTRPILVTTVALLAVTLGASRGNAQTPEGGPVQQEIARLESSLAEETVKVAVLRTLIAQRQAAAEPSLRPMAAGGETRRTLAVTPSSTMTMTAAQLVAWSIVGQLPGGTVGTVQATGSMRPLFDEHALLILETAPYDSLRIGDIVTYVHPATGQLVVHRLLEKRGDNFWPKGDFNGRMDNAYVTRANYRMRVCGILYTHQD